MAGTGPAHGGTGRERAGTGREQGRNKEGPESASDANRVFFNNKSWHVLTQNMRRHLHDCSTAASQQGRSGSQRAVVIGCEEITSQTISLALLPRTDMLQLVQRSD